SDTFDRALPLTLAFLFFFFSSRRRHTRFSRDWSSDVCSSDLSELKRNTIIDTGLLAVYVSVHVTIDTGRAALDWNVPVHSKPSLKSKPRTSLLYDNRIIRRGTLAIASRSI